MITIDEGKQFLRENWRKGVKCPCCEQLCKLYNQKLRANMSLILIEIYKFQLNTGRDWLHVLDELRPINGDYAKLRFWGLLTPKGDEPTKDTKSSGFWSITPLGKSFVLGKTAVPESVLIFDNRKFGQSEKLIHIQATLGKKFSWTELMGEYLHKESDSNQQQLL